MQSTAASRMAPAAPSGADRWLRVAGLLLAWAAVVCAVAGAFHHAPGSSRGAVALAVTLCACAVLVAWALAPTSAGSGRGMPRPYTREELGWRASPEVRMPADAPTPVPLPLTAESVPPTVTIARPAGDWQPLAAPPRPLYALDELAATGAEEATRSPFLDDPLFRLEDPGPGAWLARVGKDPTQLCQDSFACDPARRVYAVTDGVSQSFMPAAWARIVAQAAVAHSGSFGGEAEFAAWLAAAADRWRVWMHEVWLPRARPSTGRGERPSTGRGERPSTGRGERPSTGRDPERASTGRDPERASTGRDPERASTGRDPERASTGRPYEWGDWGDEIDGQGAQTTLVCCSVGGNRERGGSKSVRVDVTAIGDAECLLFRQSAERWELAGAFPLEHPSDFGATPSTLGTRRDPARVAAAYRGLHRGSFEARPGDRLALATDAVACWLLALARNPPSPRGERGPGGEDPSLSPRPPRSSAESAFSVSPSSAGGEALIARALESPAAFERLAQAEIDAGRLEDDDLSLLVIAIA